eukprot:1309303-Amphidinium_carterae.1
MNYPCILPNPSFVPNLRHGFVANAVPKRSRRCRATLRGHRAPVSCVAMSWATNRLVTGPCYLAALLTLHIIFCMQACEAEDRAFCATILGL